MSTDGPSEDLDALVGTAEDARKALEAADRPMGSLVGPEHRFTVANAAYRALTGRQDLIGRVAREVFPELEGQQVLELLDEVYTTGEAKEFEGWRYQLDRDGSGTLTEAYLDWGLAPVRDDEGSVTGLHYVAQDVTDRVQRERRVEHDARAARERYVDALGVVTSIQEALLPTALPVLPALDVAATYLLALQDTTAGGDWFDAVVRPDGRTALVVGDVVGHGVTASAVMGQLRAVLHDRLRSDEPIGEALASVDRFAREVPTAHGSTLCVAIVEPATGSVEYCTAGHPPPMLVARSGQTRYLEASGSGPLATGPEPAGHAVARTQLAPGELLLLYSDGLVERPARTPQEGTVEAAGVVTDVALGRGMAAGAPRRTSERVCQGAIEQLTRITGYTDDITLVAAERSDAPRTFETRQLLTPAAVTTVRDEVLVWMDALGVSEIDVTETVHALCELVSNAVEHSGGTDVRVEARLSDRGLLQVDIVDDGAWRAPDEAGRGGRGLSMTRGFVEDLEVTTSDDGTTATVRVHPTRSAHLLRGHKPGAQVAPPRRDVPFALDASSGGVLVTGPIADPEAAGRLRKELLRGSRGGAQGLRVDLTGVTHLGSVGVQVLHELAGAADSSMHLVAPVGSVAQHVMDLVQLPYSRPE